MKKHVFTDGSAHPNPFGYGGWAAVWETDDGNCAFISGGGYCTCAQRMEIFSIIKILEHFSTIGEKEVIIHTDSSRLLLERPNNKLYGDLWKRLEIIEKEFNYIEYYQEKSHKKVQDLDLSDNTDSINRFFSNVTDKIACFSRLKFSKSENKGLSECEETEIGVFNPTTFSINEDSLEAKRKFPRCFTLFINNTPYSTFSSMAAANKVKEQVEKEQTLICKVIETVLHS